MWVEEWIKPRAKGYVEIVRYAYDFIVMFQYENEAKSFYEIMETIKKKLIDHYNNYGVNNNSKSICDYYMYVKWNTFRILNRRHQKKSM